MVFGKKATLNSNKFVRKGYNFLGWCTNPTNDMPPFINTNLKEVQENDNTIYQQFVQRDHQMLAVPDAEREGYNFLGWFTPDGASFSKGFYVTEDIIVYPRWQKKDDEETPTPTPSPEPTPTPTPTPEDDGNPGSGSQSQGLDPKKFVKQKGNATGIGLCGNTLYMDFCAAKNERGTAALKNCRLSVNYNTRCAHYRTCCHTSLYTHPDAPGKKFLQVEVFPGIDLDKIKKTDGTEVDITTIPNFVAVLNSGSWWPNMEEPSKKFQKAFPEGTDNAWNKFIWGEFG